MSLSTTAIPMATPDIDAVLDPYIVFSLSIAAAALHILAELLGVEALGCATLQLGILLATRPCARGSMQTTYEHAQWVLIPGKELINDSSEVVIAGPAAVLLASIVAHLLLTAVSAFAVLLCCKGGESNADAPAENEAAGGDEGQVPDPYSGSPWDRAAMVLRWPYWSVSLLRVNIVPCAAYAVLQLARGSNPPTGSNEEPSSGVAASGVVLASVIVVILLAGIVLTQRFAEKMGPKWICFGGSGSVARQDPTLLPCHSMLQASGFWSDHGRQACSAVFSAAAGARGSMVGVSLIIPLYVFVVSGLAGAPWELLDGTTSDSCMTPFATTLGLSVVALLPLAFARPFRHAGVNALLALRLAALALLCFARIFPEEDLPSDVVISIHLAAEVVSGVLTATLGVIERLVWRPTESHLRTIRLRRVLLITHAAAVIIKQLRESGASRDATAESDVLQRVSQMGHPELRERLRGDEVAARVDSVTWREGDAPSELRTPQLARARQQSAQLAQPVATPQADNQPVLVPPPQPNAVPGGAITPGTAQPSQSQAGQAAASPDAQPGGNVARSPSLVFSPNSAHPIPLREGSSMRADSFSPRGFAHDRPASSVPVDSLFQEMDLMTTAISRFDSQPAMQTVESLKDPFDAAASPLAVANHPQPAERPQASNAAMFADLGPQQRSVTFSDDEAVVPAARIVDYPEADSSPRLEGNSSMFSDDPNL